MKKISFIVLFSAFFNTYFYSQTGTIKIAKPKNATPAYEKPLERLDIPCATMSEKLENWIVGLGSNYTFKKNNKIGYEFEVIRPTHIINTGRYRYYPYVGLRYSYEQVYFAISPYDLATAQSTTGFAKSQNKMQYLKVPLGLISRLPFGPWRLDFSAELIAEYLINNENIRLTENDFNKFNLAGSICIDWSFNRNYSIRFSYSKDFFENLKENNIYNVAGEISGKQKTQTDLLSITFRYRILSK